MDVRAAVVELGRLDHPKEQSMAPTAEQKRLEEARNRGDME